MKEHEGITSVGVIILIIVIVLGFLRAGNSTNNEWKEKYNTLESRYEDLKDLCEEYKYMIDYAVSCMEEGDYEEAYSTLT